MTFRRFGQIARIPLAIRMSPPVVRLNAADREERIASTHRRQQSKLPGRNTKDHLVVLEWVRTSQRASYSIQRNTRAICRESYKRISVPRAHDPIQLEGRARQVRAAGGPLNERTHTCVRVPVFLTSQPKDRQMHSTGACAIAVETNAHALRSGSLYIRSNSTVPQVRSGRRSSNEVYR
jgi:hypothetical protein